MIQSQKIAKTDTETTINWKIGTAPTTLTGIHEKEINIAIFERDLSVFTNEINDLVEQNINLRVSGELEAIEKEIVKVLDPNTCSLLIQDIKELLATFKEVTKANKFRLLLATINNNMCRKFHTDINQVRLLCTYSGPGTLWLTDDNINQKALDTRADNESIVIEESKVQQAKAGAVVLLKGAMYPDSEAKAVVHRSPTIEESGEKRLLLRIDIHDTLNAWI